MKHIFLLCFLICVGVVFESQAQDPVVIKEDGAKGDLDVEPDVSELTFRQRLHFGGGLSGLSFGNPTSIGVSPMVGYQLANNTIAGVGLTYQYYSVNYGGNIGKLTSNLLGERIFIRQYIPTLTALLGQSYLVGQVENYSNLSDSNASNYYGYSNPVLVGIGIGSKLGINLSVMYDLNYSSSSGKVSPYGSALVVQVGGFFF
ncbi:hypothetical protein [Aquirufa aurantiipilula]|uniref:Outer membrane protein beta-barrel domain-containing protein n=1 Tax=Aquirufa aurantiipilula TaxID=2696561 RepID=A0ABT6BGC9_9BACT|nr:hypothetical protein [Aquirufa aurantiipilula]MBZ1326324.1 hypothetical protein [Aquirufa aurantiipilula]MDF5689497.1 hypothetical protein [Aquirufa aurantiipilula]